MSEKSKKYVVLKFLEGLGISLIVCLAAVLALAFIVKNVDISNSAVRLICEFVKIFAVFIGCFFGIKGKKGYLKGGALGVLSVLLSYFLFSLISMNFAFGVKILIDLAFGLIAGMLSGALTVNVRKTK